MDAPVSGGEQGAITGQLTFMCGGDSDVFEKACPTIKHYAKALNLLGPVGSGQLCKMANQMAVAGVLQGLSEALHFSEKAGLDCHQVIDVISKGAAQSWQMENRSETMIKGEYNHGFAVDLMRKDLNICLSEARQLGAKLPLTALIDQFYGDIQDMGGSRWDTSSLLERLRK
jgi:3-hydroxyisobutyrate dehydrogenase